MNTQNFQIENIDIRGQIIPHVVVNILGDGACLFNALSYCLYEHQLLSREIRDNIVDCVVSNWPDFKILSHDSHGNNYRSAAAYQQDMSLPFTYGGYCELEAAGRIYHFVFEVYHNYRLYAKFGNNGNPIKRLRFTQSLSNGHFDVYIPYKYYR